MARRAPHAFLTLAALSVLALAGCDSETSGDGMTNDAGMEAPRGPAGPRIAVAPTADDALPPSIMGQARTLGGEPLSYVPGDTATMGYVAVPEGEGPFPALVIVHEWNGLVERVRQVADDFAREGYVTLAVDLYGGRTGSNPQENMALVRETMADQAAVVANMNQAVAYLKGRPDVSGRVAAMGWCFGGGVALTYGLDGNEHDATAIFYGSLVTDPARLASLGHEVYGTFAEMDDGIPPEQVAEFEAALREAGIENDLHVYDEVNHGFWLHVDQAPDVRSGPALDAWQRLKAYLDRTLG